MTDNLYSAPAGVAIARSVADLAGYLRSCADTGIDADHIARTLGWDHPEDGDRVTALAKALRVKLPSRGRTYGEGVIDRMRALSKEGRTQTEIAQETGLSATSVARLKRRYGLTLVDGRKTVNRGEGA